MTRVRIALAVLLAACATPAARAGQLDPRGADAVRVWLVEREGPAARQLSLPVSFAVRNERSMLFTVGFERRNGVRDLKDAQYTGFFLNPSGGAYPRVYAGGASVLPPCPAEVTCTEPSSSAPRYTYVATFGRVPTRLSMYVVAVNLDVRSISSPPGWTVRELPRGGGVAVRTVRSSTGVDTNVVAGVEHFTGADAGATRAPSVAVGVIPCPWGPTGPTGPGSAVLEGGGPLVPELGRYDDRHPTCGRMEIGRAANERPTSWSLRGESTGLMVAPFHLVVVELPASG